MKQLDILMDKNSNNKIIILGFNQDSQRSIGMIRLELPIDNLKASAFFHVIDTRTIYKLLLGRPWIHEAKSYFLDMKFYLRSDNISNAMHAEIPHINKRG